MTPLRTRVLATTAAAAALLASAACSTGGGVTARSTNPSATGSAAPSTPSAASATSPTTVGGAAAQTPAPSSSCPTSYAPPDPKRPIVSLLYSLSADRRLVVGQEKVRFTPDRTITELVFRLWANSPRSVRSGTSIRVTRAEALGAKNFTVTSANAGPGTQGTLLRLKLPRSVPAGTPVDVVLDFRVVLGVDTNERWGRSGATQAWWASLHPMLAWVRGVGWAMEPATSAFGEAAVAEVFRLRDLAVDLAGGDQILATGWPGRVEALAGGRKRHHFSDEAVRDALVAVGRFRTASGSEAGVPITVGVSPGVNEDPVQLVALHRAAMRAHAARFGPFPYRRLAIAVIPALRGGIEYPGAIFLGPNQRDATLSHEVAHEYFYGLLGNNQGRDPWLDEALATYAEALHRGTGSYYRSQSIPADGKNRVGAPMSYWESHLSSYHRSVYTQGAAALLEGRAAVGAAPFDRAMRCWVNANANRVADPASFERAFSGLPKVLEILRRVGALPAR